MTDKESDLRAACRAALDAALVGEDPVLKAAILAVAPTVPATDPASYVSDVIKATNRTLEAMNAEQVEHRAALAAITAELDSKLALFAMRTTGVH